MRLGRIKHWQQILLPQYKVAWTNEAISLLGTIIPNDRSRLCELNYGPKLTKIKKIMEVWKQRNLTLYGRVQLIKTSLITQIIYLMLVLPRSAFILFFVE